MVLSEVEVEDVDRWVFGYQNNFSFTLYQQYTKLVDI